MDISESYDLATAEQGLTGVAEHVGQLSRRLPITAEVENTGGMTMVLMVRAAEGGKRLVGITAGDVLHAHRPLPRREDHRMGVDAVRLVCGLFRTGRHGHRG